MSTTEREGRAMRANGTAFAILYEPRAIPDRVKPRIRNNPKRTYTDKVLRDLENTAPAFNTRIATQADSRRTAAIKGKL